MENDNGVVDTTDASVSVDNTQDSSQQSISQADPLKNLKAEMNRKLSKINDSVSAQLAEIKSALLQNQGRSSAVEAEVPDYKRYVDARFQESHQTQVKQGQEQAWQKALELYPELNQDSENFDERFYRTADKYFGTFDLSKDPEAPLKAVKLAALDMGKIEQLTKERLLKDEARRSRIISEGATAPREGREQAEPQLNAQRLARLGIKDPKKLAERIKANPDKYGKGF